MLHSSLTVQTPIYLFFEVCINGTLALKCFLGFFCFCFFFAWIYNVRHPISFLDVCSWGVYPKTPHPNFNHFTLDILTPAPPIWSAFTSQWTLHKAVNTWGPCAPSTCNSPPCSRCFRPCWNRWVPTPGWVCTRSIWGNACATVCPRPAGSSGRWSSCRSRRTGPRARCSRTAKAASQDTALLECWKGKQVKAPSIGVLFPHGRNIRKNKLKLVYICGMTFSLSFLNVRRNSSSNISKQTHFFFLETAALHK